MSKYKSTIEEYFSYYLEELKDDGYIEWWDYECSTYNLSDPLSFEYSKIDKRGKISTKSEHIARKASITADFTIKWSETAKNVFYLDNTTPIAGKVKDIPFRVDDSALRISQVETKGSSERSTSSSVSFPYKQKWCYQLYNIYIQKIKPFCPKKGLLFGKTFTPRRVMEIEVYKRDCKFGKKGCSKIKYKTRNLNEYIEENR